ncbi:Nse4 C-terminal-domain-containing protein [Crepidotus variabilis]|uniref:Non-structural maintenance of chromosomes element 4 n=1 Tax=Crepidotus variabilis TaxID=179855 RepID=A0A9P6EI15_9AGAR|nr:Nse4 C-terminal-domain-containing protein [Crepidotus variabilis]
MSDNGMDTTEDFNEVFDPDQDPEEKRAVRQNYRSLTKKIEEHQANPNDITTQDLLKHVSEADTLFDRVKGPQEATLDSHLLLMASNMGAQKARAMKSGSGAFDIDDFVGKLVHFMRDQKGPEDTLSDDSDGEDYIANLTPLDWDRIGRKAMAKSRRVPPIGFMLGPLSIEQKKRTLTRRAKLEKSKEDERKPQQLNEEDIQRSENETTKNVAVLQAILDQTGSINLFEFVINPENFAQSVENIFYLSFLIRDGKVAFEMQDGEPFIYTCEQPQDKDYEEGLKKNQMVLEFDRATWQRAIEVFNIKETTIPTRKPAQTRLGDKWYG